MFSAMYEYGGVGLAAPQVGNAKKIIVVDSRDKYENGEKLALINPEIVEESEEKLTRDEGCLSFPFKFLHIERSESILVKYLDEDGEAQERRFSGFTARIIQHEVDHINGIVFTSKT